MWQLLMALSLRTSTRRWFRRGKWACTPHSRETGRAPLCEPRVTDSVRMPCGNVGAAGHALPSLPPHRAVPDGLRPGRRPADLCCNFYEHERGKSMSSAPDEGGRLLCSPASAIPPCLMFPGPLHPPNHARYGPVANRRGDGWRVLGCTAAQAPGTYPKEVAARPAGPKSRSAVSACVSTLLLFSDRAASVLVSVW